jgi:hypothetical protein
MQAVSRPGLRSPGSIHARRGGVNGRLAAAEKWVSVTVQAASRRSVVFIVSLINNATLRLVSAAQTALPSRRADTDARWGAPTLVPRTIGEGSTREKVDYARAAAAVANAQQTAAAKTDGSSPVFGVCRWRSNTCKEYEHGGN